jgi:hypothetical protein
MTVAELKEALAAFPDDFKVILFDGCCDTVDFKEAKLLRDRFAEAYTLRCRHSDEYDPDKVVCLA